MDVVSHKQFRQLLADHAREHRIPLQGAFELTPVCNLDCKMCYVHLPESAVKGKMLSGDEWIALMDEAISAGMIYALLTGGEALTHPDFWKIYRHLNQKGIRIQLKSNGVLLCGENLKRLREMPPDAVDISLYGCNGEAYQAVTGQDVFEKVTENIRAVRDAGIPIRIMVTPSRAMLPWVEETIRLAKSFGAQVRVNGMLIPPQHETKRALVTSALSVEEYWQVSQKTKEILQADVSFMDEEMIEKPKKESIFHEIGLACTAGKSSFTVRWKGYMAPCLGFPDGMLEQNVRRLTFLKAWSRMSEEIEAYEIPEDCRTCDLKDKCIYCPSAHGTYAGKHQCNHEICQYKHMLENGMGDSKHD